MGDGGEKQLTQAMRVHANFAEYTPLALLLIYMAEAQGAYALLVHLLCLMLLAGRLSHAYGVSQTMEDFRFRIVGMSSTFLSLTAAAGTLLTIHIA